MKSRPIMLLLSLAIVAAACGDTTAEDGTTTPDAASIDTVAPDGGDLPLADGDGGLASGFVVDGGLSITDALASDSTEPLAVTGALFGDESGWRLCEALAESFPPQCGGPSLTLPDFDSPDAMAYLGGLPIEEDQGISWMNDSVTLLGEVIGSSFVVDFGLMG